MSDTIQGRLDLIASTFLWGWAWDSSRQDEHVTLDIYVSKVKVGTVVADTFRTDLLAAGMGDGCYSFRFPVVAYLTPDTEQTIRICVSGTQVVIDTLSTAEYVADALYLNSLRRIPVWRVYDVEVKPDELMIRGVVISSRDFRLSRIFFTVNGERFPEVEYPALTPSLAEDLWFLPGAGCLGFRCCMRGDTGRLFHGDHIVLDCRHEASGERLRDRDEFYVPASFSGDLRRVPGGGQMARVQGMDHSRMFVVGGYTTYKKLESVLRDFCGRSFGSFSRILDWGCGCGRLTRYLIESKGPQVVGADVDGENIRWCQENLHEAQFEQIPFFPPTSFESSSFDLAIGISVFTHLREADQFRWLEELSRICKDGAVVLMSFQGETSLLWGNVDKISLDKWRLDGFSDRSVDPALDGVTEEADYYRSTFHSRRYIEEHWSKYFEIVGFLEAFSANIQDLVVMRKTRSAPGRLP